MVNTYSIYTMDIQPKGFSVVEIDGYVTEEAVIKVRTILEDAELCRNMVEQNYAIGTQCFSYGVLRQKLQGLIADCIGCW